MASKRLTIFETLSYFAAQFHDLPFRNLVSLFVFLGIITQVEDGSMALFECQGPGMVLDQTALPLPPLSCWLMDLHAGLSS